MGTQGWAVVAESLARPYRVPLSMVVLAALVPLYILVPEWSRPATRHVPELALDRALPLVPTWALVYGALYLFLIVLPIVIVRQDEHIRRTVHAYLLAWITAYVFFFWLYPTAAPRPAVVTGDGFSVWGLRALYASDPPYNCFPSLHVAHSFISALACARVHRGVGIVATACATLVAVSTLLTKQHYVADVIAGVFLALAAYSIFLRRSGSVAIPDLDRRAAPLLALHVGALSVVALAGFWMLYLSRR